MQITELPFQDPEKQDFPIHDNPNLAKDMLKTLNRGPAIIIAARQGEGPPQQEVPMHREYEQVACMVIRALTAAYRQHLARFGMAPKEQDVAIFLRMRETEDAIRDITDALVAPETVPNIERAAQQRAKRFVKELSLQQQAGEEVDEDTVVA